MEIIQLRQQLVANGIEPVTRTGEEWLVQYKAACRVMRAAHEALVAMGTSKEMLDDSWSLDA